MGVQLSARLGVLAVVAGCLATHGAVASEGTKRAPKAPQPSAASWLISARGVGGLQLGAAPPAPRGGFDAAYTTTFYSDAQPLEGFKFDDPPATAYVEGGPFFEWGYKNPGEEPPAKFKKQAGKLARAKKLTIGMIVITDPRPKTDKQIGVGADYATFASAYPAAGPIKQWPGLWEEPSCVIRQDPVWYFFDRCDERGKIIRVVVQQPRKQRHADED